MTPGHLPINMHNCQAWFTQFVDNAKTNESITGSNAWHIKKTFLNVIAHATSIQEAKQELKNEFYKMGPFLKKMPPDTIINAAFQAIDNNQVEPSQVEPAPGAPHSIPITAPHVAPAQAEACEKHFNELVDTSPLSTLDIPYIKTIFSETIRAAESPEQAKDTFIEKLQDLSKKLTSLENKDLFNCALDAGMQAIDVATSSKAGALKEEPLHTPTCERAFDKWLEEAEKKKSISHKNATSLRSAFSKAIRGAQHQNEALESFLKLFKPMEKYFTTPILPMVRKAASDAINAVPKTVTVSPKTHDAASWSAMYTDLKEISEMKTALAKIYADTEMAIRDGFMVGDKPITLDPEKIHKMQGGTEIFQKTAALTRPKKAVPTTITVLEGDTLAIARMLKESGLNPVVLNMANKSHPGGGYKYGARAQEESMFRSSAYCLSLVPQKNPFLQKKIEQIGLGTYEVPEFGAIYSPGVPVFREGASHGFAFILPVELDMIASAAYDLNKENPDNYAEKVMEKIRGILRVAATTGHDSVVLGAFGCGAFKNDPELTSQLFEKVLQEPEFKGWFTNVVFAIVDDHNVAPEMSNLGIFKRLDGSTIEPT